MSVMRSLGVDDFLDQQHRWPTSSPDEFGVIGMRKFRAALVIGVVTLTGVCLAPSQTQALDDATGENESAECPPPAVVHAGDSDSSLAQEDLPVGTDVVECGLVGVIVEDPSGFGVEIPEPGSGVTGKFDVVGTESVTLSVATTESGEVYYPASTVELDDRPPGTEPLPPCDDDNFNVLTGNRSGDIYNGEQLHYNESTFPSNLNPAGVETQLVASFAAWTDLYSECTGVVRDVGVDFVNAGNSNAGTAISANPFTCAGPRLDNYSQVEFGPLPGSGGNGTVLGATCRHQISTPGGLRVDGADVRMNSNINWTLNGDSPTCSGVTVDFRSVMTHEAGHWWGLTTLMRLFLTST